MTSLAVSRRAWPVMAGKRRCRLCSPGRFSAAIRFQSGLRKSGCQQVDSGAWQPANNRVYWQQFGTPEHSRFGI